METKNKKKKKGIIGSMVESYTQPGREVLGQILAVPQAVLDPQVRRATFGKGKGMSNEQLREAQEKALQPYRAMGISDERIQDMFSRSPIEHFLKTAAGLGSYVVPPGANLPSAIGMGMLQGALQGYGTSNKGQELQRLSSGAVGGGIGGGIGYGASKAIGAGLQKLGQKTVGTADDVSLSEIKQFGQNVSEMGTRNIGKSKGIKLNPKAADPYLDALQRTFKGEKIAASTGNKFNLKGLSKSRTKILENVSSLLKGNTKPIGTVDEIIDSVMDIAPGTLNMDEEATRNFLTGIFKKGLKNKGATKLTAQDIAGVIRELDDKAFVNKFNTSNPTAAAEMLYNELRPRLGAAIPEINPLYKQLSQLYEILPDMAKFTEKGGSNLQLGGNRVPFTGDIASGAQALLGSAQRGIGDILQNINIPQIQIPSNTASKLGATIGSTLPSAIMGEVVPEQPAPAPGVTQTEDGQATLLNMVNEMKNQGMSPDEVAKAMLSQGINPDLVESVIVQAGGQKASDQPLSAFAGGQGGYGTGFGFGQDVVQTLQTISALGQAGVPAEQLYPLLIQTLLPSSAGTDGTGAYSQLASLGINVPGKTETERETTAKMMLGRYGDDPNKLREEISLPMLMTDKEQQTYDETGNLLSQVDALLGSVDEIGTGTVGPIRLPDMLTSGIGASFRDTLGEITAKEVSNLAGKTVTAAETKLLLASTPLQSDTRKVLAIKLNNMRNALARKQWITEQAARYGMTEADVMNQATDYIQQNFPIMNY